MGGWEVMGRQTFDDRYLRASPGGRTAPVKEIAGRGTPIDAPLSGSSAVTKEHPSGALTMPASDVRLISSSSSIWPDLVSAPAAMLKEVFFNRTIEEVPTLKLNRFAN